MIVDISKEEIKIQIWEKASTEENYDPNLYRKDACGAWMAFEKYGDTSNAYGWEIDHVFPRAKGGESNLENLRPMNWQNNRKKGDNYPNYQREITSEDNRNIVSEKNLTINQKLQDTLKSKYGYDKESNDKGTVWDL